MIQELIFFNSWFELWFDNYSLYILILVRALKNIYINGTFLELNKQKKKKILRTQRSPWQMARQGLISGPQFLFVKIDLV